MNNYPLFADMPVLSMITNFSKNGNFERIYLVMERSPENRAKNEVRKAKSGETRSLWNGPGNRAFQE